MTPATLEVALAALSWISPNGTRSHWISMGIALKSEFGDDAKDGFIKWSETGDSYDVKGTLSAWKSFKPSTSGLGVLFKEALHEGFKFEKSTSTVSPEKIASDRAARAARHAQTEANRIKAAKAAGVRAAAQWRMAALDGESPYLVRKQVLPEACRFPLLPVGSILIPLMDYAPDVAVMRGKQQIFGDGEKKNSSGLDKHAAACRMGDVPVDGQDIGITEGYATALTIRMATNQAFPVLMALDAGNMIHVARVMRAKYPASRIVLVADDDYLTGQPGLAAAQAAADAVGNAIVIEPVITAPRRATKANESLPKLTDFNDLHCAEGLTVVTKQIRAAMAAAPPALPPVADLPAPILPAAAPAIPVPVESPGAPVVDAALVTGLATLEWCIAHCALVQGSTDVWDALNKLRMKQSAFVAMAGKATAKAWTEHADKRSVSPRHLPKTVRGVASDDGGAGADNIVMMLERYVLLYGTKTVWDMDKEVVLGYDAMQLARGDLATRWLEHPLRREIDHDNLVFDPTQKVDLATHINMFKGFPLVPKADEVKAELVLDLLYSLCMSEDNCEEVFQWVIKWLAYPLQHPGAKMQTALLFFGEKQGTGKSLFFEGLMKPIYGEHGATGGQHQLEGTYSMWRSKKMYVLFEEILSRQDKYSHFGLIKHMITGRDTSISQKFRDDRTEANHLNVVMLSNEFQAVPIEPEDRRFLVVNVLQPLDDALLAKINQYPPQQLSEALYAFLLSYPLDGYTPHTKPLMTPSKAKMINFGRPDWESFYLSWAGDEMSAPFCSCLSLDLYLVYKRHCAKYGFRQIPENKFAELIGQRVRKDRQWVTIGPKKQLLTLFIVPDIDAKVESYTQQCVRFRDLADIRGMA